MAINDVLDSFARMEEYSQYLMDVEYQFYHEDNDIKAFQLAQEAKQRGHRNPIFDYIIGFCYNNGRGVAKDKRRAGEFFKYSAEARDANGSYYDDKHSNESRVILAEDFVFSNPEFNVIDADTALTYCKLLLQVEKYHDDAILYLAKLYGRAQYGCQDTAKAQSYLTELLRHPNPSVRAKASAFQQEMQAQNKKRSFFRSLFG